VKILLLSLKKAGTEVSTPFVPTFFAPILVPLKLILSVLTHSKTTERLLHQRFLVKSSSLSISHLKIKEERYSVK
jgi:hypothetical protein